MKSIVRTMVRAALMASVSAYTARVVGKAFDRVVPSKKGWLK